MPTVTRFCLLCGAQFVCKDCPSTRLRGSGKFCSMACSTRFHRTGKPSNNWRGGRKVGNGYVLIHKPGDPHAERTHGYAKEHRLIAAAMLGRPLTRREIVHHVNGDRTDNRPENLEIMTQSEHMRLHNAQRRAS